jgi:two-component system chemotaxis sensor kinase CheA
MDDLLADFLTETNEALAELDVAIVKLERTPDDSQTLSLIFRMVHTIKGTCGFLGLPRLERVAHAAENVLGKVRDGSLTVTPDLVSNVLFAIDRIKAIVAGIAASESEPAGDDTALIAALDAVSEGTAALATAPAPVPEPVKFDNPAPSPVSPPPTATLPTAAPPATEPHAEIAADMPAGGQTIRVGVDVLEGLMTLVSELVLTRNQLLQLARTDEQSSFAVPLQRLSHITSDLQEGVMKTRMQPIGNAWNKLPRLVRDLGRDLGKKIELVMLGAETELDRQVLELIKDPLTHMVRNSGDHGLETPAERHAAGKPEGGRITLNAFHEGGHIIIEIADDGRGLPTSKIRAKLLDKGLATQTEIAGMSDAQVHRFIFRAGFSTASAITAVSGRGVGMDVVKTNIERIGGTIDLRSSEGHGSTFTIKIPLTLAIVSALIVEAAGERFAIPQISVVELVRARVEAAPGNQAALGAAEAGEPTIERIDDTPVLRLRNRLLPLVNLNSLLQLGASETAVDEASLHIIVAQVGAGMLGIIVDRIFDTEEIVVKPVAPILRHITMFSGNTILGDGSVIMILDPNGIARATGVGGGDSRGADPTAHGQAVGHKPDMTASQDQRTSMLLFHAGGDEPKAVPLGLVARLENIECARIEISGGRAVTQYRGRLMPLVPMSGVMDMSRSHQSVLVFTDADRALGRDRCMGLVVDGIDDVIDEVLKIELGANRPGLLGSAIIAGKATDLIDTGYWVTQAFDDWFRGHENGGPARSARILIVEDSDFFRQLLAPALASAGFTVCSAASASEALRLRDAGEMFDAIVSDIEMPEMNGLTLVRRLRASGPWAELPVIALTGHATEAAIAAGRDAGFTDYVQKFEREALLGSLRQCLATRPSITDLAA